LRPKPVDQGEFPGTFRRLSSPPSRKADPAQIQRFSGGRKLSLGGRLRSRLRRSRTRSRLRRLPPLWSRRSGTDGHPHQRRRRRQHHGGGGITRAIGGDRARCLEYCKIRPPGRGIGIHRRRTGERLSFIHRREITGCGNRCCPDGLHPGSRHPRHHCQGS